MDKHSVRVWIFCAFSLWSHSVVFSREVASHDLDTGASGQRQHSNDEAKSGKESYKVSDFQWRCGAQPPSSTQGSYFILAMVEKNANGGFHPAKERSLIAECRLLEVDNGYVERAIGEVGADSKMPSVVPGTKLGKLVPEETQNYIVLYSRNPMSPPDFISAPCGEQGADRVKQIGTLTDLSEPGENREEKIKNSFSGNSPKVSAKKIDGLSEGEI